MSITLNTLVYNQDASISANKVQYTGPLHSFQVKDLVTLGRTAPKATTLSDGKARSELKRTKTVNLTNGKTDDAIITVNVAYPVGMAEADADAIRDDIGDLIISAIGKLVTWNHDLTH